MSLTLVAEINQYLVENKKPYLIASIDNPNGFTYALIRDGDPGYSLYENLDRLVSKLLKWGYLDRSFVEDKGFRVYE